MTREVGEADHCGVASSPSLDEVGLRNAAEDEGKWEVSAIVSSDRLFVSLWPEFADASSSVFLASVMLRGMS